MTQESREALARRLRALRAEHQLTLRQAAREFGVTRETIAALEHGERGAHTSTLEKIAEGYGVSLEDLLGGGALPAREWALEKKAELHGMDDREWNEYVQDLDTTDEVAQAFREFSREARLLHTAWHQDKAFRPAGRARRRELTRGLRELRTRRYADLAGQAALLHARDLVEEIFSAMTEEEATNA
jgi:transcriptional regulator with XRE-family HTH domain